MPCQKCRTRCFSSQPLDKIVGYFQRISNRNWKLKQVSKPSVQKSMHVTFSFAFSYRYANMRTSTFSKVVQQHTEGIVESIIWMLLEMYFSFQQWKNCENPLRIDKVTAMSLVYYFLGHSVVTTSQQRLTDTANCSDLSTATCLYWHITKETAYLHCTAMAPTVLICGTQSHLGSVQ